MPQELGPQILQGTDVANMGNYMENLSRTRQATKYLEKLQFESSEAVIRELKELEREGLGKLATLFKVLLQSHSAPFDLRPFLSSAIPKLPVALVQNLSRISGYLFVGPVDFGEHVQGYVSVRAPYLVRCIQPLATPQPPRNENYVKSSSPMIAWTRALGILIKAEYELADSVLPDPHNIFAFNQSILSVVQQYTDAVDTVLQRIKRNASQGNFKEFWLALDLSQVLEEVLNHVSRTILVDAGSSGQDLQELATQLKTVSVGVLSQWILELREAKGVVDGNVDPVTSVTLSNLRRLAEYSDVVEGLLGTMGVAPPLAVGGPAAKGGRVGKFVVDNLDTLLAQLDAQSRGLKPGLNSVFLVNNYSFLLKQLRHAENFGVSNVIQVYQFEAKLDALLQNAKASYLVNWKPCVDPLRDDPSRQAEAAPNLTSLSKSLREAVKDRIGTFNRLCDERLKSGFVVPDVEVRQGLVNQVKQMVVPLYQQFYERYLFRVLDTNV